MDLTSLKTMTPEEFWRSLNEQDPTTRELSLIAILSIISNAVDFSGELESAELDKQTIVRMLATVVATHCSGRVVIAKEDFIRGYTADNTNSDDRKSIIITTSLAH